MAESEGVEGRVLMAGDKVIAFGLVAALRRVTFWRRVTKVDPLIALRSE